MELRAYILRRLLLLIPVLFGVTLLIFALLQLFDPVERAALYVKDARQFGNIAAIIEQYGLDQLRIADALLSFGEHHEAIKLSYLSEEF